MYGKSKSKKKMKKPTKRKVAKLKRPSVGYYRSY